MNADPEEPFYSAYYGASSATRRIVWTRAGVGIGAAYVPPPAPVFDEASRIQSLVLLSAKTDGEYTGLPSWINRGEIAAAEDEHVQAMAATPSTALDRVHRVVDWIVYAAFIGLVLSICVAGWNRWLPGGGN